MCASCIQFTENFEYTSILWESIYLTFLACLFCFDKNTKIYIMTHSSGIHHLRRSSPKTSRLTYIPQLLAGNIQYQYIFCNIYICIAYMLPKSVEFIYWYWRYILPTYQQLNGFCAPFGRRVHFVLYILLLHTKCQHLGNICQLGDFCAPFGRRVDDNIFCITRYICIL